MQTGAACDCSAFDARDRQLPFSGLHLSCELFIITFMYLLYYYTHLQPILLRSVYIVAVYNY